MSSGQVVEKQEREREALTVRNEILRSWRRLAALIDVLIQQQENTRPIMKKISAHQTEIRELAAKYKKLTGIQAFSLKRSDLMLPNQVTRFCDMTLTPLGPLGVSDETLTDGYIPSVESKARVAPDGKTVIAVDPNEYETKTMVVSET